MRNRIVIAILIILSLVGLFWLYNHGFLTVVPDSSIKDRATYSVVNQVSGKSFQNTTDVSIKRLVTRSGYSLFAVQGNRSYFSTLKTKGFLQNTSLEIKGRLENSRTFVGNNPSNCMNLIGGVLVSYQCPGKYSSLVVHEPATATTPTFTKNNINGFTQNVEGIVPYNGQGYLVMRQAENIGSGSSHLAYPLLSAEAALSVDVHNSLSLNGLDNNTDYTFSSYKDGLLAYDNTYSKLAYFPANSLSATSIISVKTSKDVTFPVRFDNNQDSIVEVFTNSPSHSESKNLLPNQKLEIVVIKNNQGRKFAYNSSLIGIQLCGTNKLCIVGHDSLSIYDISGNSLKHLFDVYGVTKIIRTGNGILALRDRDIWFINPDSQTGYDAYSLGNYQFSQFAPADHGALLTLTNDRGKKVALYLNLDSDDTDSIDFRIGKLLVDSGNIKDVSVWGKIIYISPNYGELSFQSSTGNLDFDPVVVAKVNKGIAQDIASSGIGSDYQIINPYK